MVLPSAATCQCGFYVRGDANLKKGHLKSVSKSQAHQSLDGFSGHRAHFLLRALSNPETAMSEEGPPPQSGPPQQGGPPPGALPINIQGPNGEQPTPEQIRQIQRQLQDEAEKHGISVQEYVQRLREQAMAQQQAQMRAQQEAQQQQQQQPIQPGPPKPEALAVANWLKSQDLKPRTVVHDEKRKDMFRGGSRENTHGDYNG